MSGLCLSSHSQILSQPSISEDKDSSSSGSNSVCSSTSSSTEYHPTESSGENSSSYSKVSKRKPHPSKVISNDPARSLHERENRRRATARWRRNQRNQQNVPQQSGGLAIVCGSPLREPVHVEANGLEERKRSRTGEEEEDRKGGGGGGGGGDNHDDNDDSDEYSTTRRRRRRHYNPEAPCRPRDSDGKPMNGVWYCCSCRMYSLKTVEAEVKLKDSVSKTNLGECFGCKQALIQRHYVTHRMYQQIRYHQVPGVRQRRIDRHKPKSNESQN